MSQNLPKIAIINRTVRADKNGNEYITYKTGSYINEANQLVPGQYYLLYDKDLFEVITEGMEVLVP